VRGQATAGEEPGYERIRVPHLSGAELVAAPDRDRNARGEVEHPPCGLRIVCEPAWAVDRFGDVRDHPVAPAVQLVAEEPEPAGPARPDRPLHHDPARRTVVVEDRSLFDHEPALRHVDLERGVVQVARSAPLQSCNDGFVDAPVEPHAVAAGA